MEVAAIRTGTGRTDGRLLITVLDDGSGLPEGFDPQRAGNLGLQIVRTLVEGSSAARSTCCGPSRAAPRSSSTSRPARRSSAETAAMS